MFNMWTPNSAINNINFDLYSNLFNNALTSQLNAFSFQSPFSVDLQLNNSNNSNNFRDYDSSTDDEDDEPKRTIYCANLDERITEELLYEVFLQAGPLESVRIPKDNNGRQRSFGFVVFHHVCSVPYALNLLNGLKLFQRNINIQQQNSGGNGGGGNGNNGGISDHRRFEERRRNPYSDRDRHRNMSPPRARSRSPPRNRSPPSCSRSPPSRNRSPPLRNRLHCNSPTSALRGSPSAARSAHSAQHNSLLPHPSDRRKQQRYSRR